jgi:hypothetical protein
VLRLAEQVDSHEPRVGRLVRDHEDLRRAGQHVDPDFAEELPLRLRDVRVAGADDHVGRRQVLDPAREGSHRLHAAEAQDRVRARGGHGVEHGRVDAVAARRRARHDRADAGHLGDDHGHEGRREHRVAAARHV